MNGKGNKAVGRENERNRKGIFKKRNEGKQGKEAFVNGEGKKSSRGQTGKKNWDTLQILHGE